MYKMIALFKKPEDPDRFDNYYFHFHIPLTKKIPGLKDMKITKFKEGSPYYLMCEMIYESKEAFKEASKTPESKESGKDIMAFAGDLVTFLFGEDVGDGK
ncbi:EthD family reductase [Fervidibacillus halotolerans]|uniref:EthD family reductase n=1 Tax=Fervidibacillus halotolerans TaxID=2980027 RepID=A0A9E8RXK2_9BACI|nr:EthD family reductase [Fervidibacillus halotolerans]WAA11851.1 EthD family reductase [Fervidibacillus halotolerans]